MRTNIELNDDLVAGVRKYSKAKTKRALVEEALTTFVAVKAEEQRRRTYNKAPCRKLRGIQAKTNERRRRASTPWVPATMRFRCGDFDYGRCRFHYSPRGNIGTSRRPASAFPRSRPFPARNGRHAWPGRLKAPNWWEIFPAIGAESADCRYVLQPV